MRDTILALLDELERAHGVRVLHACESGSRAWYVRVHEAPTTGRDSVIEYMSEDRVLDAAGWDLRKALALLHKSNPPLFEHLHSPITYRTSAEADELCRLAERPHPEGRGNRHRPTRRVLPPHGGVLRRARRMASTEGRRHLDHPSPPDNARNVAGG